MWYAYLVVLACGVATAIQPGQNATLAKGLPQPLTAGLVSGLVTSFSILVVGLATRRISWIPLGQAAEVPWWAWLGGVLGAAAIIAQLQLARQIGAGTFLGLIVTAGVVTSIALDHFGLVGFEVHRASLWRVLGGLLMIVGVGFVAAF